MAFEPTALLGVYASKLAPPPAMLAAQQPGRYVGQIKPIMGNINFSKGALVDVVSEQIGYKAGLALTIPQISDHLANTDFDGLIAQSEKTGARLESIEFERLFYKLLHKIGHTEKEYDGDKTGINLWHKYSDNRDIVLGVNKILINVWPKIVAEQQKNKTKSLDPSLIMQESHKKFGKLGLQIAFEKIKAFNTGLELVPGSTIRKTEWKNIEELDSLFKGSKAKSQHGEYFDQRFINYLCQNQDSISTMHWRKFEELTAEYFGRNGFSVELGPGSNDDGVDVRIWKPGKSIEENPSCIIQCKRHKKSKIEKVVIKGLYADIEYQGAEYGLIVTSTELSPGSRNVITARGYPIQEVNRKSLGKWLEELRTPGTGIVRV